MIERDNTCPICSGRSRVLLTLAFSESPFLPDKTQVSYCEACDFIFSWPGNQTAYDGYYAANKNDIIHDDVDAKTLNAWHTAQAGSFGVMLKLFGGRVTPKRFSVLDFGCGSGVLIRSLATRYPGGLFHGFDVNAAAGALDEVACINGERDVQILDTYGRLLDKYDFLILSHVIEHLIDFDTLSKPLSRMSDHGLIYLEVPNAVLYYSYPRREFLSYFDRLHVNHFSTTALSQLLRKFDLKVLRQGNLCMPYKDGSPYPAKFVIAGGSRYDEGERGNERGLLDAFEMYVAYERSRAEVIRSSLAMKEGILAYGFGDNFFKSRYSNGPLHGVPIDAVIDRRWETLRTTRYGRDYRFMNLDEALSTYPCDSVVVTISSGTQIIVDLIKERGEREIIIL